MASIKIDSDIRYFKLWVLGPQNKKRNWWVDVRVVIDRLTQETGKTRLRSHKQSVRDTPDSIPTFLEELFELH